jgi:hypothetical protein
MTTAGLDLPFTEPVLLAIVAFHIFVGLICVLSGAVAMLSPKGAGRHPRFGKIYFWALAIVFVSATVLAATRWADDYHLFILGAASFGFALFGRSARRRLWPNWPRWHIAGMGMSYVLLLTAFYVDNGKNLPLWKELPVWSYWALPALVGAPIIIWALLRHPVVKANAALKTS